MCTRKAPQPRSTARQAARRTVQTRWACRWCPRSMRTPASAAGVRPAPSVAIVATGGPGGRLRRRSPKRAIPAFTRCRPVRCSCPQPTATPPLKQKPTGANRTRHPPSPAGRTGSTAAGYGGDPHSGSKPHQRLETKGWQPGGHAFDRGQRNLFSADGAQSGQDPAGASLIENLARTGRPNQATFSPISRLETITTLP